MRWYRWCVVTFIALLLLVPTAVAHPLLERRPAVERPHRLRDIVPNYRFFIAIGRCEQPAPAAMQRANGRWRKGYEWGINWHSRGASYPGGLGVWAPLWREKGIAGTDMAPSADRATPVEQMIHAQRIVKRYGLYAWGCTGVALSVAPYRNP